MLNVAASNIVCGETVKTFGEKSKHVTIGLIM
jgi:hypothetical protein